MSGLYPDDAAVQLETLALLAEAAEYLGRMPPNALTRELKTKIESHLKRPGAGVQKARIEAAAKDQEWRARFAAGESFEGVSRFTPSGLPVVQCLVLRGTLHLRSPAYDHALSSGTKTADSLARSVGREIVEGVSINLRQIDSSNEFDRKLLASWPQFKSE